MPRSQSDVSYPAGSTAMKSRSTLRVLCLRSFVSNQYQSQSKKVPFLQFTANFKVAELSQGMHLVELSRGASKRERPKGTFGGEFQKRSTNDEESPLPIFPISQPQIDGRKEDWLMLSRNGNPGSS